MALLQSMVRKSFHLLQPLAHSLHDGFWIDRLGVIDHQHLQVLNLFALADLGLGGRVQPLFVLLVELGQVVERDGALAFPRPLLDPVAADLGFALDVDGPLQIRNFLHFLQVLVTVRVHQVFDLVENAHVLHDGCKHMSVRQQAPLGYPDPLVLDLVELGPPHQPGHEGVDLECETPPLRVVVIEGQQIDISIGACLFPRGQWLLKDCQLRHALGYHPEDGGLAAADVAFDGNEILTHHDLAS